MNSIELFHQYNGKRPVYFTALLFNKLTSNILYSDDTCIVTGLIQIFKYCYMMQSILIRT